MVVFVNKNAVRSEVEGLAQHGQQPVLHKSEETGCLYRHRLKDFSVLRAHA